MSSLEFFYCCLMQRLFVKNAIPYYFLVFFQFFYQILNSSNKANLLSLIYPPITFWSSSKWLTDWPPDPIVYFHFISLTSFFAIVLVFRMRFLSPICMIFQCPLHPRPLHYMYHPPPFPAATLWWHLSGFCRFAFAYRWSFPPFQSISTTKWTNLSQ